MVTVLDSQVHPSRRWLQYVLKSNSNIILKYQFSTIVFQDKERDSPEENGRGPEELSKNIIWPSYNKTRLRKFLDKTA
jgi:hypothetical protein